MVWKTLSSIWGASWSLTSWIHGRCATWCFLGFRCWLNRFLPLLEFFIYADSNVVKNSNLCLKGHHHNDCVSIWAPWAFFWLAPTSCGANTLQQSGGSVVLECPRHCFFFSGQPPHHTFRFLSFRRVSQDLGLHAETDDWQDQRLWCQNTRAVFKELVWFDCFRGVVRILRWQSCVTKFLTRLCIYPWL